MAKFTLTTPVRVGDLNTGITIGQLTLVAFSMNFQADIPTVSITLRDTASGWLHSVMLTDAEAFAGLAAIRAAFPTLETAILTYFANQGKLPAGTVS